MPFCPLHLRSRFLFSKHGGSSYGLAKAAASRCGYLALYGSFDPAFRDITETGQTQRKKKTWPLSGIYYTPFLEKIDIPTKEFVCWLYNIAKTWENPWSAECKPMQKISHERYLMKSSTAQLDVVCKKRILPNYQRIPGCVSVVRSPLGFAIQTQTSKHCSGWMILSNPVEATSCGNFFRSGDGEKPGKR